MNSKFLFMASSKIAGRGDLRVTLSTAEFDCQTGLRCLEKRSLTDLDEVRTLGFIGNRERAVGMKVLSNTFIPTFAAWGNTAVWQSVGY